MKTFFSTLIIGLVMALNFVVLTGCNQSEEPKPVTQNSGDSPDAPGNGDIQTEPVDEN